ncbi:MAG TPA: HAD family hydrolase [Acidobacteriota bacterium]|nr:HAD family hydrolase [Acidobacteriota bacterium]
MQKLEPKAIIFDLGSTLIEYEAVPWDELSAVCVAAARTELVRKGISLPGQEEFIAAFDQVRQAYRERAQSDLTEWNVLQVAAGLFEAIGVRYDEPLLQVFFDAYYVPVGEQLFAFEDTVPTLQTLRGQFPVIGLVSNTVFPEEAHLRELDRFGISPYLDFTLFSSTFKLRKPHPDIFYRAANLAGYAPSECVYVGDRYVEDVQGPNAVGMPAVLKVKPGRVYPDDMPAAVRRIDTLSGLLEHLENGVD